MLSARMAKHGSAKTTENNTQSHCLDQITMGKVFHSWVLIEHKIVTRELTGVVSGTIHPEDSGKAIKGRQNQMDTSSERGVKGRRLAKT